MKRRTVVIAIAVLATVGVGWCGASAMRVAKARSEFVAFATSDQCICTNAKAVGRAGDLRFFRTWLAALGSSERPELQYVLSEGPMSEAVARSLRDGKTWEVEWR